jgi:hypothetical protein
MNEPMITFEPIGGAAARRFKNAEEERRHQIAPATPGTAIGSPLLTVLRRLRFARS